MRHPRRRRRAGGGPGVEPGDRGSPRARIAVDDDPQVLAAVARDIGDAVHHQHIGYRQLGVAGAEHASVAAFQQLIGFVGFGSAH